MLQRLGRWLLGYRWSYIPEPDLTPVVVPDPLLEEFERLEASIRSRALADFQANCPHPRDRQIELRVFGRVPQVLCTFCSKVLDIPTEDHYPYRR